ncbi:MAG: hypothetical protein ACYDHY_17350 [Acidiferrobacterales bacterium]
MKRAKTAWIDDDLAWQKVLAVRELIVDELKREINFSLAESGPRLLRWLERDDGLNRLSDACRDIYVRGYGAGYGDCEMGARR